MKRFSPVAALLFFVVCAACSLWTLQAAAEDMPQKTYAVVIAHNGSQDEGVSPLRYADDDGVKYWQIFSSMADEVSLLTTMDGETQDLYPDLVSRTQPPTLQRVQQTLEQTREKIAEDLQNGIKSSLYVVFVGHGAVDDNGLGYLSLVDGKYTREDLAKDLIESAEAERTHLIIDACHAYFMVNARGDGRDDRSGKTYDAEFRAFLQEEDMLARNPSVGVLLSTSGAAEVHEWSRFQGGVFSHEVRSGLLGAADANGDLFVSYPELEAYLAAANASVTHPRARIHFFAKAPRQARASALVSLESMSSASLLQIQPGEAGRYHIEDSKGVRYADFNAAGDSPVRVALLPQSKHYFVRRGSSETKIIPPEKPSGTIYLAEQAFVESSSAERSGSVEEAYRENLFATPFGESFYRGYTAGRSLGSPRVQQSMEDEGRTWEVMAGFGFSPPQLTRYDGVDGIQSVVEGGLEIGVASRLSVQLLGQYGTSTHKNVEITDPNDNTSASRFDVRLHRPALGVGLRYAYPLGERLSLSWENRSFYQWLIFDGSPQGGSSTSAKDVQLGDKLSWRGESLLEVGVRLAPRWRLGVKGGVSASVISLNQTTQGEEIEPVWDIFPQGGVTVRYRF